MNIKSELVEAAMFAAVMGSVFKLSFGTAVGLVDQPKLMLPQPFVEEIVQNVER